MNKGNLVIIGNGFDLGMGYKTSYSDFLKSSMVNSFLNSNGNSVKFEFLGNMLKGENWVDIELEIGRLVTIGALSISQIDYLTLKSLLINYLKSINYSTIFHNSNPEIFIKKLIGNELNGRNHFLNFNYTPVLENTIERLFPSYVNTQKAEITYLHGSIYSDEIVFGVEDSKKLPSEYVFLLKSFDKAHKRIDFSALPNLYDSFYVYGHSLGKSDHARLKPLILELMDNKNTGKFSFTLFYFGEKSYLELHQMLNVLTDFNMALFKDRVNFKAYDVSQKGKLDLNN